MPGGRRARGADGFDARAVLEGGLDDVTVRQAVEDRR